MDYSTWLTKHQAAEAIGVTTKTVERFVQAGQIQQARWQRDGRGPLLAVYHPDDVARVALERRQGPLPPFVVPVTDERSNGNGHGLVQVESKLDSPSIQLGPGTDLLRVLVTAAARVMSETSETSALFLTLDEASAFTGLTPTFLTKMIKRGTLPAIKDRTWKIRRKDLEQL
jgi:excisionase family DNA binding protein